ncbi:MAG: VanW family protein [Armatimonadetes bacterium]|nr:VanW family protein [Armatimonadota bacterium]
MRGKSTVTKTSAAAAIGAVAYLLATSPFVGVRAPIVAGFPLSGEVEYSSLLASTASSSARDAAVLESAFAASKTSLLGSRVIDLGSRDFESAANVRLSAEAIDDTILQPNEVFSFNGTVGIRTPERGFQSGLMYSNGQLVTGVGGGICIASTAVYNVALETGMAIIERHPHSGPVAYAEPGRDSAVAYGVLDLKFRNNTGAVVLIRSIVQDDKLVVAFYGTRQPGREIEIVSEDFEPLPYEVVQTADESVPEGEQVVEQKGRPGHSVSIVRIIRQNGKVVGREVMNRDFMRPRNEIVRVNPGPRESGTAAADTNGLLPPPIYLPIPTDFDVLPLSPDISVERDSRTGSPD